MTIPGTSVAARLSELESSKRLFGESDTRLRRTLSVLSRSRFSDAQSLISFHEAVLFLSAYPPSAAVLKQVKAILASFESRVSQLREAEIDLAPLDEPEISGIVTTTVTSNFSYEIVRWLVEKYPDQLSFDWEWFENEEAFGAMMPKFLPLLDEDAMVEAHVPYRDWVRLAAGRQNEVVWLIEQIGRSKVPPHDQSRLYDSLKLHVLWKFAGNVSRTTMSRRVQKPFFHQEPLIQRRDISLEKELASAPIEVDELSQRAGEQILDFARATSAVRYRELHGFTYGDTRDVLRANLGRGVEAYVTTVPPAHRLPLRAYHAALIFKNGVPMGYFEGLSLFERIESGFNLYYTFRDGETAWLFARILRLMRQLLGVTVISIEPYQIGHENEEGIDSGAFWFYRKLGFRPVRPELMKLTLAEEKKIQFREGYRTPARTLRKLAGGHLLFEMSTSDKRAWDRFQVRNLGFALQRKLAKDFAGDAAALRAAATKFVERTLDKKLERLPLIEEFASALLLIPDLPKWPDEDKHLLAQIIEAKAHQSEALYLRLMQRHKRMRAAMIQMGS